MTRQLAGVCCRVLADLFGLPYVYTIGRCVEHWYVTRALALQGCHARTPLGQANFWLFGTYTQPDLSASPSGATLPLPLRSRECCSYFRARVQRTCAAQPSQGGLLFSLV